jgi:hypothetical protein
MLAAALLVLIVILFVRSHYKIEGIGWRTHDNRFYEIFSDRGNLCFDLVEGDVDYPLLRNSRLICNRVRVRNFWVFTIDRPAAAEWGTQEVMAAGDHFPYERWGLDVTRLHPAYEDQAVAKGMLVPATELHWHWKDEYYLKYHGTYVDRDVTHFGVRIVEGLRSVPIWTDEDEFGVVKVQRARTVAISYWLLIASLLMLSALLYFSLRVSERLRQRQCRRLGRCIQCGYDLRASSERCSECGKPINN